MGSGRPVSRRAHGAEWDKPDPPEQPAAGPTAPGGRVIVRIERFIGHGAHVHVSMREQPAEGDGAESAGPEGISPGRERYMKFRDRRRALQWVDATFQAEFDPDNQELVFLEGATRRWFYGEGD